MKRQTHNELKKEEKVSIEIVLRVCVERGSLVKVKVNNV